MRKSLSTLVVAVLAVLRLSVPAIAADATLHGRVTDPDGLALPGVAITLTGADHKVWTAVTDGSGAYSFTVAPGHYEVRAQLDGFQAASRTVDANGTDTAVDLTLGLAPHQEEVTVKAEAPASVIGQPQPDAPVTVTREVVDNGMLPNSQYDDVLPLLPNVVRGPDGQISVAGARAEQGALFVNGFNETDPVSGAPALILPVEAIDSMDVFSGGYSAELGRATGGVTSVHTRAGADEFHSAATSFFPRMRFVDGHVAGVDYWEPNTGASGPIVKGRLYYEEAASYRFDRNKFDTVVGTQDQKFNELSSWTQFDVHVSPQQHVLVSFSLNPQTTNHANITAFTPASTVPQLDRSSYAVGLGDRVTLGRNSTLELHANLVRTGLTLTPYGTDSYEVGHDLTRGSYFDSQNERGARGEGSAVYSRTLGSSHFVKAGASFGRAALNGVDNAAPVDLLWSNGAPSERITFLPATWLSASAYELGAFVQDTWTVLPAVTIDGGVRYDRTTAIGQTVSPRVAWTVKLPDGRSTIGGSIGLFGDKVPLEARVFPSLQSRVIQIFDPSGVPIGPAVLYTNAIDGPLKAPIATRWDLEFDRRLSASWQGRIKYQQRHGRDEQIVTPFMVSSTSGLFLLQSTGTSQSRSIEATAAYHHGQDGNEFYASYVRSQARGDLNSFAAIEGVDKEPFIQPDQVGPLPADVPNRVLVWGVMHLPWQITFAPFVEVRDGFPYSAILDDWTYAGARNTFRFPWFGSLDVYVNKVVHVSNRLPASRLGFKVYSLAAVHSERDVQRDINRTDFGTLYNAVPRYYSFVFELLWGKR